MRKTLALVSFAGLLSVAQAAPHTAHVSHTPPPAALAEPKPELSLSVYNNNLALVQDVRHLNVSSGRSRLEFEDVSAAIKPETVALSGKGLTVVEQNFDYDLLTPQKMMEKAVGKQIQILRTNPATGAQTPETATVLSVNEGVVLRVGNHIEVLRDDGIPTRVIFSSIPENLRAQPTLSVTVDAQGGGARDVTLSYLTTGLSWNADYVALYNEKLGTMRLQGWITLTNKSGTSFKNAKTQLIAGDINLSDGENQYYQRQRQIAQSTAGSGASSQTAIADYYLYRLSERVTVAENQTKQVGFLDIADVKAAKTYEYRADSFDGSAQPAHTDTVLKFSNKDEALPSGIVRVYMRDDAGDPKFIGEDALDHTPAGSDLTIKTGEAFDVTAQGTVVSSEKISAWNTRYAMSYVFKNAGPSPVTVDFVQSGLWRDGKVEDESLPSKRIDASTLKWSVPIAANGTTTLTFTVASGG